MSKSFVWLVANRKPADMSCQLFQRFVDLRANKVSEANVIDKHVC